MKKIIATFLTILIILNIYIPSTFATDTDKSTSTTGVSEEGFQSSMYNGTGFIPSKEGDTVKSREEAIDPTGTNNSNAIITALLEVLVIIPKIGSWVMSKVVLDDKINYITDDGDKYSIFTIQDMLFGKFYLFDINFFNTESVDDVNSKIVNNIKENVAIWYIAVRNIAIVGSALIIIYIAVRLAIAISGGKAAERARYNKMITSWLIGLILIFVLQYLVRILFYFSSVIINFINNIVEEGTTEANMEKIILVDSWNNIASQKGMNKLIYVILYWALVYYQLKFFLMYAKRSLETFFLMIISPLVCMLYPIDFIGDGRSQSFQVWLKTLLGYIVLQPIHLCIYAVFMASASEISTQAPLVGIVFFAALSNGEKIVKSLFGLEGPTLRGTKLKRIRPR